MIKKLFGLKTEKQCAIHGVSGFNQMPSIAFDLGEYLKLQPQNGQHKVYGRIYKGNGSYFDPMNFYPIIGEEQHHYVMMKVFSIGSFMSTDYWNKYDVRFNNGKITAHDIQGKLIVNRLQRWFLGFGYCN